MEAQATDHDYVHQIHPEGEPTYTQAVFATGIQLDFHNHPSVTIATIDNTLVAFPSDGPPEAVNFGAYIQDVLAYAQAPKRTAATPDLKATVTVVFYNPESRRFEKPAS